MKKYLSLFLLAIITFGFAQNKPVQGGYFAGYYNGKANIVGKRLFIEA